MSYTLQTLSKYFFLSVQLYCRCCQFKRFSYVNWFSDKCLSKFSLRPTEQCSGMTGNSGAFKTGTLNIITFFIHTWVMVIFFYFLDSLYVKEYVCVCNLMNGSVVLFTSLLCPNSKNKKEKEKPHFHCFKILPSGNRRNIFWITGFFCKTCF